MLTNPETHLLQKRLHDGAGTVLAVHCVPATQRNPSHHQRVAIGLAADLGQHRLHASRRVSVVRLLVEEPLAVAAVRVRIAGRLDDDVGEVQLAE